MNDILGDVHFTITPKPNPLYSTFADRLGITIQRRPLFTSADRFFTLGSCFAQEIRAHLSGKGVTCLPALRHIQFDPQRVRIDALPEQEHMNFYNTFSVLQQLEKVTGAWEQDPDDYWTITQFSRRHLAWTEMPSYQDPYLRTVLARTVEELHSAVSAVDEAIKAGFEAATAFLFTFGMTEVFVNQRSGKIANQKPGYASSSGGKKETTRIFSPFKQNLKNVRAIVEIIRKHKPGAPIVMTVSPVALAMTFGDGDIVATNMESKSILRAVLGQVSREYDNVFYFPAYELVTAMDPQIAYRPDRRHVLPPVVDHIVSTFQEAYFADGVATVSSPSVQDL